ncbi:hypothetical protein BJ085DRAFT_31365 [Dimargaris cristalligena]|uniref:RING-type domain-containing protein n=1 Tax=Dimargaris cristalligena TaxID=215637 RepID=A0A4V1J4W6_9FUNG|nr:hypothetical protein BJ085DRAFT_31365 [Dimargaris cristalligena]|eukprot:RKP36989.1 hypothetical protein BJ085DRAFT_31365 [Dimargaris cristalligena]
MELNPTLNYSHSNESTPPQRADNDSPAITPMTAISGPDTSIAMGQWQPIPAPASATRQSSPNVSTESYSVTDNPFAPTTLERRPTRQTATMTQQLETADTVSTSPIPTPTSQGKRPVGRPRKRPLPPTSLESIADGEFPAPVTPTRRRGRPPGTTRTSTITPVVRGKRRGRPPRSASQRPNPTPRSDPTTTSPSSTDDCFMCGQPLPTDMDEINHHIDMCLGRQNNGIDPSSPSSSSVSNPSELAAPAPSNFVSYTWAGETRIRASALLQTSPAVLASGPMVSMRKHQDIEGDLDIDEEELKAFGEAQYTDVDIQRLMRSKRPVSTPSARPLGSRPEPLQVQAQTPQFEYSAQPPATPSSPPPEYDQNTSMNPPSVGLDAQIIIESLKNRIREQEDLVQTVKTCLICMEAYQTPLVSTICWHVHCEQCWLHTLGVKKLCPQCQVITQPTDLRRIYL